jgi:hypothetical protein
VSVLLGPAEEEAGVGPWEERRGAVSCAEPDAVGAMLDVEEGEGGRRKRPRGVFNSSAFVDGDAQYRRRRQRGSGTW